MAENPTVWKPPLNQEVEYALVAASSIVDSSGVSLVDPSDIQIIDTGVEQTNIPDTVWTDDAGL